MPSAINDTIPVNGAPLQSAPVRANFAAAKAEIEALQSSVAGVITASSTTTLTNKTISGANNTLTNIAQSSVTNLTADLALKANLANPHVPVATSRVAQLSDTTIVIDNATASAVNITLPLSATLNFDDGIILSRYYSGTGLGTFIPAGGVTIQGTAPTPTQFGYVSVQHITGDTWTWVGGSGGSGLITDSAVVADYFVDPLGNDTTGTGTGALPFATLERAITAANAATGPKLIYLRASLNYTRSAITNIREGVSISGAGRDLVNVKITQTAGDQSAAGLLFSSTVEGTAGNQYIENITLDGGNVSDVPFCSYGINIRGRSNVIVRNCRVKNFGVWGVTFNGQTNEVDGIGPTVLAFGNKCYGNIIENSSQYVETGGSSIGYGLLQFGGQFGLEVYENTLTQTTRPSGQNGYCIKHHRNGYNVNCHFWRNTINRNNTGTTFPFDSEAWNCFGLHWHHNTHSGALDIICNKGTNAVMAAGSPVGIAYGAWIYENTWNITTQGLTGAGNTMCVNLEDQAIGACSDILIERNTDIGNGSTTGATTLVKVFSTATALKPLSWNNVVIRNNLKVGGQILGELGANANDTFSNWKIHNNTGDGKDRTDRALDGISMTKATWTNAEIRQNILCNYRRAPVVTGDGVNSSVTGLIEDANLYFECGNPTAAINNIRTHIAASGATVPTGVTGANLNNPASMLSMFVDSTTNNYRLKQGAQVRNVGAQLSFIDLADLTRYFYDVNGVLIPQTDAGAYRYVGTAYNMPVYTVNRTDNFNRANGAIGTPSDGGSAWRVISGTWVIASNQVSCANFNAIAVLNSGSANVRVKATITSAPATTKVSLFFRTTDANNYMKMEVTSTQAYIVRHVAGSSTNVKLLLGSFLAGDVMECIVDATGLITMRKNGIVIGTATDNTFNTITEHGLGANNSGTFTYDDFEIANIT